MKRTLFGLAAALLLSACGGASNSLVPSSPALRGAGSPSSPIQHVVIVIQENRSFDNLFDCFKGTACVKRGKEKVKEGSKYVDKWVTLTRHALVEPTDIGHCYYSFSQAYDNGKMDGFNHEALGVCPRTWGGQQKNAGTYPYQYVNPAQIAPYWDMAKQYVLADNMFQTQGSGSFTAHQDLIRGGTALAGPYGSSSSLIDTPSGMPWGCDAPPNVKTDLITLKLQWANDNGPYPCTNKFPYSGSSNYITLATLLDAAGIGWRYYSPCFIDSLTPACKGNTCKGCSGALLNAFDVIWSVRNGPEWGTNVSMPQTNIFTDISNGALQPISWVIPTDQDSDHPTNNPDDGPSWVASVVNAIGESSYWSSTAIIVLWDDWGGFYDHVPPPGPRDDQGGRGLRVPMIVISPYVPQGEVAHTQYEFGSILKYIENNWDLGSLDTTDKRAAGIDKIFNYNQQPRSFTAIPSARSLKYFLHEGPSRGWDPE